MLLSISQKIIAKISFDSLIMLRFGKVKVAKETFFGANKLFWY